MPSSPAAAPPAPGSADWQRLVTASKVAAILGLSPWASPRSVWHQIRGEAPADDGRNGRVKSRGQYLEAGILDWWCDQHPEFGDVVRQYHATREDLPWAAATPDALAHGWISDTWTPVVVDAKTARDDAEWGTPGTDEVPAHYAAQMQWAMHLSGARRAYIALLTSRLDLREYVIDYDPVTADAMESICRDFWQSTQIDDAAPPVDDSLATFTTLKRLHQDIDQDVEVDLDAKTATEFVEATAGLKAAETRDRKARATVLDLMGRARLATHDGVTIARRQPNSHGVSLTAVAKTLPRKEDQ